MQPHKDNSDKTSLDPKEVLDLGSPNFISTVSETRLRWGTCMSEYLIEGQKKEIVEIYYG